MTDVEYEIVTEVPAEAVIALYRAGGWWRDTPEWRDNIAAMVRGSFCFMVARTPDGTIAGMGRALSDGVSAAYIQDVVVLSEHRRRGIGAELVRRLAEHCRARGLSWIGLVAEPGTMAFYQRLGFRPLVGYQPMLYGSSA